MKPQIFFDEAGNSGDNLLDTSQPIFTLVSHNYEAHEARQILQPLRSLVLTGELHFKKLKENSKNHDAIVACLNHELLDPARVHIFNTLKEYLIVTQIVDYLIEPVLYKQNVNLYNDGQNIAMANVMYIMGNNGWEKSLYQDMCSKFVLWGRKKITADVFYDAVNTLLKSIKNDLTPEIVWLLSESQKLPHLSRIFETYALDPTFTAFVAQCSHWKNLLMEKFDVFTDASKPIEYWRGMIDFLANVPEAKITKGFTDYSYPLMVDQVIACDSETSDMIQLSDLLASSANYALTKMRGGKIDKIVERIGQSKYFQFTPYSIWPSNKVTPAQLRTVGRGFVPDTLNFLADQLKSTPGAIESINRTKW